MKKHYRVLAAFLALSSINAYAFSDVSDPELVKATNTLSSLSIVNGVSENVFSPNGLVTRAQFAKMSVLALGDEDTIAYKNLTIFPDVPHTHWASQYINSAVKKHSIIRGLPDGTFNPNGNINYGEAITMLLYMLDYEIADIGAYWPQDYVSLADKIGLSDGISFGAYDKVTRGDAAILISNLLSLKTEKGTGEVFAKTAFPNSISDVYLIPSESSFAGNISYVSSEDIIDVSNGMDNAPLGAYGTLVFSDSSKDEAIGFIQDGTSEKVTLNRAEIDLITTNSGKINITNPDKINVVIGDRVSTYDEMFLEFFNGSSITINRSDKGIITSIVADNNNQNATSFLYSESKTLPAGYKIIKDGAEILKSSIKTNEVVTIDNQNKTIYVSNRRVTGIYEGYTSSAFFPNSVTVLGSSYTVLDDAKSLFKNLTLNKAITLYLDHNGNVVHATNSSGTETVYLKSFDGEKAEIVLDSGRTSTLTNVNVDSSGEFSIFGETYSSIYKSIGKLVEVSPSSDGLVSLRSSDALKNASSNFDVINGTIGSLTVSPSVEFYDGIDINSPFTRIYESDITLETIKKENILGITTEGNVVTRIVFENLTGDTLDYGMLSFSNTAPESSLEDSDESGSIKYTTYTLETKDSTLTYKPLATSGFSKMPAGVAKNTSGKDYFAYVPILELESKGTVTKDSFLGLEYVKTSSEEIYISDEVLVYDKNTNDKLTLAEALQNYEKFTVYSDNALQRKVIRVITVS